MTIDEASNKKSCPNCSNTLEFNYLGNNSALKIGFCSSCWGMPIFCIDCQIWSIIPYISDHNSYNWSCSSCGTDSMDYVTACVKK